MGVGQGCAPPTRSVEALANISKEHKKWLFSAYLLLSLASIHVHVGIEHV